MVFNWRKLTYLITRRHQSPIIPVRVGPHAETFYVHRDVLTKAEYFRRALDGQFKESQDQAIDLPEEDPAIFSFVVAFLYEDSYEPIKPVAKALGNFVTKLVTGHILTDYSCRSRKRKGKRT